MRCLAVVIALAACGKSEPAKTEPPPKPRPAAPAIAPPPPATGPTAWYDRRCAAATDCIVVKPATCDPCGCPTDAIASKEMAAFDEAQGKLDCSPPDLKIRCEPCAPRVAACESGVCVAVPRT